MTKGPAAKKKPKKLKPAKPDVPAAISALKIAMRNVTDIPMVNLSLAVALQALGVSKEEVLRSGETALEAREMKVR